MEASADIPFFRDGENSRKSAFSARIKFTQLADLLLLKNRLFLNRLPNFQKTFTACDKERGFPFCELRTLNCTLSAISIGSPKLTAIPKKVFDSVTAHYESLYVTALLYSSRFSERSKQSCSL